MNMSFLMKCGLCTSAVIAILSVAFTVASCDDNNSSNGESPVTHPSTASYDSIYNQNINLYVIPNDTIEYKLEKNYSELRTEELNISNRLNDYSSEMLKNYADINKKENTILSPISAIMVYAMMANFPADDSENIFKKAMHVDDYNMNDINSYSRKVINHDKEQGLYLELVKDCQISNNIWMRKDMTIYQSYLSMANFFATKVKGVDMNDNNSLNEINNEIKKQVGSSVTDIGIDKKSLSSVSSIVTSSLSFRQEWTNKFEKDSTDSEFNNVDGVITQTRMLKMLTKRFAIYSGFCMAEIPYEHSDFSMYILLPEADVSVNECLSRLQERGMHNCLLNLKDPPANADIYMSIPQVKFNATTALNRSDGIISKDIAKMYSINLPKVSPNGFALNNIYQSCSIDINEFGTNATSNARTTITEATKLNSSPVESLNDGNGGSENKKQIINYIANRPFIILIRNNKLGFILFACCINSISD